MDSVADKLKEKLQPLKAIRLEVIDDSDKHIGHAGNPDGKGETHFTLEIVSATFAGKSRLQRHRLVMDLVQQVWQDTTLHALSLRTFAPGEDSK
jgi:BolA family transcriptional regulator, general stress-responsive regulator